MIAGQATGSHAHAYEGEEIGLVLFARTRKDRPLIGMLRAHCSENMPIGLVD